MIPYVFNHILFRKKKHVKCPFVFFFLNSIHFSRNQSSKKDVSGNHLPFWKRTIYQDTFVKPEEASTYQELDVPENTYQNTAIQ